MRLLYLAHVLTLGSVFLLIGNWLSQLSISYANIVLPYLSYDSGLIVLSALLLLYQPPLLDILPLYIFLMALTPVLWHGARRLHWSIIGGTSIGLWLWAQFYPMATLLKPLEGSGLILQWGPFHWLGWQLLWVVGFAFGVWHGRYRASGQSIQLPNTVRWLALGIAIFFWAWRWPTILPEFNLGDHWYLADKWVLGPIRLVNFAALLLVALGFAPLWRAFLQKIAFLAILGRHSLWVFSVHVVLGLLLAGWVEWHQPPEILRLLLVITQISLIFIGAQKLEQRRKAAMSA